MNSASQRDMPQVPFLWTRGVATRETLNYLDKRGVDAEPLLSKAELSRHQLQQDLGGVSVVSQHRFIELAAIIRIQHFAVSQEAVNFHSRLGLRSEASAIFSLN